MALKTGFLNTFKGKVAFTAETIFAAGGTGVTTGVLTNGFIRPSGAVIGGQFVSSAGFGNTDDTTEDVLFSTSLPAGAFDPVIADMENFRSIYLYAWGLFAANTHSKVARLRFGSSIVVATAAFTTNALTAWALEAVIYHEALNTQVGSGQIIVGGTHEGVVDLNGTETENAGITIEVTGQTGTAAANDVLLKGFEFCFNN